MQGVAILYLLVILYFIYRGWPFRVFKDPDVSGKTFAGLFLLKSLAIPAVYLVYAKMYGGLEKFDAGNFYNDAKAINAFSRSDFLEYLKLLFGLQDDREGSYVYTHCLVHTNNWDNGKIRDFFFNDNRVVIRIHSLLHFIAFNSYFVHALFNCFFSFIGISCLYKALKDLFKGKELLLLLILCFFPSLWFYTGAVLKEGIALFVMGCSVFTLKKVVSHQARLRDYIWLILLLFTCCFLKPYLLCSAVVFFGLFFVIRKYLVVYKGLAFLASLCLFLFFANVLSLVIRHKSLPDAALARQRIFADAAKGGIFLLDSLKFVRLEYDSTLVKKTDPTHYTIRKNAAYIYWEHTHQQDTLLCKANRDTTTRYQLVYKIRESGSNFGLDTYSGALPEKILSCLYISLAYPLFVNAKGVLQILASFENLAIILSGLFVFLGFMRNRKDYFPCFVFLSFALFICILVGLTTPNSGAIFRYRSPAVIFILASALYYSPFPKKGLSKNGN